MWCTTKIIRKKSQIWIESLATYIWDCNHQPTDYYVPMYIGRKTSPTTNTEQFPTVVVGNLKSHCSSSHCQRLRGDAWSHVSMSRVFDCYFQIRLIRRLGNYSSCCMLWLIVGWITVIVLARLPWSLVQQVHHRLIFGLKRFDHITPALKLASIPTGHYIRSCSSACVVLPLLILLTIHPALRLQPINQQSYMDTSYGAYWKEDNSVLPPDTTISFIFLYQPYWKNIQFQNNRIIIHSVFLVFLFESTVSSQ